MPGIGAHIAVARSDQVVFIQLLMEGGDLNQKGRGVGSRSESDGAGAFSIAREVGLQVLLVADLPDEDARIVFIARHNRGDIGDRQLVGRGAGGEEHDSVRPSGFGAEIVGSMFTWNSTRETMAMPCFLRRWRASCP